MRNLKQNNTNKTSPNTRQYIHFGVMSKILDEPRVGWLSFRPRVRTCLEGQRVTGTCAFGGKMTRICDPQKRRRGRRDVDFAKRRLAPVEEKDGASGQRPETTWHCGFNPPGSSLKIPFSQ